MEDFNQEHMDNGYSDASSKMQNRKSYDSSSGTIAVMKDNPLPDNPLAFGLNSTGFSLGAAIEKARVRAALSVEALEVQKNAIVQGMRQQVDLALHSRQLSNNAVKMETYERALVNKTDLVQRLEKRLDEIVNALKSSEISAIMAAEEDAQQRRLEVTEKLQKGAFGEKAAASLMALIEEQVEYKARSALLRCREFLGQTEQEMLQSVREFKVDMRGTV